MVHLNITFLLQAELSDLIEPSKPFAFRLTQNQIGSAAGPTLTNGDHDTLPRSVISNLDAGPNRPTFVEPNIR